MADPRYNRWQGIAITQFSVAVALMTAFSASALGTGLSLLQSESFRQNSHTHLFAGALLALLLSALLSCASVISRTLDFRFTARKVRRDTTPGYDKPLTFLGLTLRGLGKLTWGLFWLSCISLLFGVFSMVICIACTYSGRLM